MLALSYNLFGSVVLGLACSLLCSALISGILSLVESRKKSKHLDEVSLCTESRKHWLTGHLFEYNLLKHEGLVAVVQRMTIFPKMFCFWFHGFLSIMHLYHPTTVSPILTRNANDVPKNPTLYNMLRPWLGQGLITSEGGVWAKHRRLITPSFHFNILKHYNQVFNECARVLVEKWSVTDGELVEVSQPLALMTFDSLMKCAMSKDTNCQTIKHSFVNAVQEITKIIIHRLESPYRVLLVRQWIFNLTPKGRRFKKVLAEIDAYANNVISKRRAELEDRAAAGQRQPDFLDMLLTAKEGRKGLSDKEVRDEVNTFMFAGHDTTSSFMSWAM